MGELVSATTGYFKELSSYQNKVVAILEIASTSEFSDLVIEFLELAKISIGIELTVFARDLRC